MKDFDALKDIWSNQAVRPKVSPEDVLKRVKQTKNEFANKLRVEVMAMSVAILALSYVWVAVPFKLWTSHVAIAIFIISCLYVMFAQYADYRRMIDSSLLLDKPGQYIAYLKSYKRGRHILNTRKYTVYSLSFSLGFILLFVEIFFIAQLWLTILGILFTVGWFLFCYYVLMKNYIRKEESKLEDMIANLERLERQFMDDKTAESIN
jgi:Ca2+/Na+ antiporter